MEKHDDSNLEEAHESEFDQIMSKAVRDILEGNITPDAFLKLARSRDADAVRYAIRRMADPSLELWEEQILQRVVFQSGVVLQLIADLARKFPGPAEAIARATLREAADHHGLHIRTEDAPLVMRALAEVQEMPQTLWAVGLCGNRGHLCLLEFLARSDRDTRVRQLAVSAAERIHGAESASRKEGS